MRSAAVGPLPADATDSLPLIGAAETGRPAAILAAVVRAAALIGKDVRVILWVRMWKSRAALAGAGEEAPLRPIVGSV